MHKSLTRKSLNYLEIEKLLAGSEIIQSSSNGPKVLRLENGHYFKIFRLKRWLSSAFFIHYADRFLKNYKKLVTLQIPTIEVLTICKIPRNFVANSKYTKAIEYNPLAGVTVRELIKSENFNDKVADFAKFIAKLHNLGVYFRSTHFANIIYNREIVDSFGLIDIENIKFYHAGCTKGQIKRNFNHMMRYSIDKNWLLEHRELFWGHYLQHSAIKSQLAGLNSSLFIN